MKIAQDFDIHHASIAHKLSYKWELVCEPIIAYANVMAPTWKQILHLQDVKEDSLSTGNLSM